MILFVFVLLFFLRIYSSSNKVRLVDETVKFRVEIVWNFSVSERSEQN